MFSSFSQGDRCPELTDQAAIVELSKSGLLIDKTVVFARRGRERPGQVSPSIWFPVSADALPLGRPNRAMRWRGTLLTSCLPHAFSVAPGSFLIHLWPVASHVKALSGRINHLTSPVFHFAKRYGQKALQGPFKAISVWAEAPSERTGAMMGHPWRRWQTRSVRVEED